MADNNNNNNGTNPQLDMIMAVMNMKQQLPEMLEAIELMGKLHYQAYKSLTDSGFTSEQALEIVKARGNILL